MEPTSVATDEWFPWQVRLSPCQTMGSLAYHGVGNVVLRPDFRLLLTPRCAEGYRLTLFQNRYIFKSLCPSKNHLKKSKNKN